MMFENGKNRGVGGMVVTWVDGREMGGGLVVRWVDWMKVG